MGELTFLRLGVDDYDRAKRVLNAARHPGFVGRELYHRCATTGICCLAVRDGIDLGVALVTKDKLQALSVARVGQGGGVGSALMAEVKPRWVSSILERVAFFERLGYTKIGGPRVGANGKHATQLLERTGQPVELTPRDASAAPPPPVELPELLEDEATFDDTELPDLASGLTGVRADMTRELAALARKIRGGRNSAVALGAYRLIAEIHGLLKAESKDAERGASAAESAVLDAVGKRHLKSA